MELQTQLFEKTIPNVVTFLHRTDVYLVTFMILLILKISAILKELQGIFQSQSLHLGTNA